MYDRDERDGRLVAWIGGRQRMVETLMMDAHVVRYGDGRSDVRGVISKRDVTSQSMKGCDLWIAISSVVRHVNSRADGRV